MTINSFRSRGEMDLQLANRIAQMLDHGQRRRGLASMALSGGTAPAGLYRRLSTISRAWSTTFITLVDERWVAADHPDSNERLVRASLLRDEAATATMIGFATADSTPAEAITTVVRRLDKLPLPLDVVVLGMGEDGHTASWFPGAENLCRAVDPDGDTALVAVVPPAAPYSRMTLTLPAVLDSRLLVLQIVGETAMHLLERAVSPGPVAELPVRAVLRQEAVPVEVYWAP
ncbi:MAG: 6-phosphogluconolactonase [Porticoccaceae bacterium]|jgi:6-phosphogluconolactonase